MYIMLKEINQIIKFIKSIQKSHNKTVVKTNFGKNTEKPKENRFGTRLVKICSEFEI